MRILVAALLSLGALVANAQGAEKIVGQYVDSLSASRNQMDSEGSGRQELSAYGQYKLFAQSTFYHDVAKNALGDGSTEQENSAVDAALMSVYLNHPDLIENSEDDLRQADAVKDELTGPIRKNEELARQTGVVPQEVADAPVDVVVEKPKFWTLKGDYYLQFMQNYISGNWYKGGESNYSMIASATLEANYDDKGKWKWDNKLEMKLGFQTSKADSIHHLKTSEDLLRLTSKVGLQATKNWYYTLNVVASTQFMRGYKNNDTFTYSDFISPFKLNVSLGMNYQVEWLNKKLTGNILLSPLAYNFVYVDRLALSKKNGLKEGHHALHDLGSTFEVNLLWKFSDNISWKTRMYGFTTYKRAELEWENEFTFKFNKYISSKLFLYPRFDDSTPRDADHGYWQFKEYFSLGFNYTF